MTISLSNVSTKQRELDGLIEALQKYNLRTGLILTYDEEGEEIININAVNYNIIIKPIWKWLLESDI